jgi:hypothetical protein
MIHRLPQPVSTPPASVPSSGPEARPLADGPKGPRAVVDAVEYSAFGSVTAGPRLFAGLTERDDSDLCCQPARRLDASPGEWLQEEPVGCAAGDGPLRPYVADPPDVR